MVRRRRAPLGCMTRIPIPIECYLHICEYLGAFDGERRWRSIDGQRLYTWDAYHGEIEVFNKRGRHLGAAEPMHGVLIKPPVKGRKIDV